MNQKNKIKFLSLFTLCLFGISLMAQSSTGGNLMVAENGVMAIYGNHNFAKGSGLVSSGMVYTSKTGNKGYLLFEEGSSWTGASNDRFVDGHVKVMHSQPFVFPIGDNQLFRPVAISGAYNTSASYHAKSPKKPLAKITSNGVGLVSDTEYWDVTGEQQTHLSFQWGRESNIAEITQRQLDQLTVVGWKNGQWRVIPSTIKPVIPEEFTASKVASDFKEGVITTNEEIVPNDFEYFTLAAIDRLKLDNPLTDADFVTVFPNPVVKELQVNIGPFEGKLGTIKIYNIDGKEISSRVVDGSSSSTQRFDATNFENGMYRVYLVNDQQSYSTEFIVNKKY